MKTYFALVQKDTESAYGISFPDIPGCFSAADDEHDIFEEAQVALSLYARDASELPIASSVSALAENADVRADISEGAFLIAVPLVVVDRKARYNLMLDQSVVEGVDQIAKTAGVSRSEFVSRALGDKLKMHSGAVLVRKSEATSSKVASAASKVLKDPKPTKAEKSVAASALTQKGSMEKTSAKVASTASKVLSNPKSSAAAKSAAASALTQKTAKKKA